MKYRLMDHTADLRIEVMGGSRKALFENAAWALSDLIADPVRLTGQQTLSLRIKGDDPEDLMFNWLRELLYLWHGKALLVKQACVDTLSNGRLAATITGDTYDPGIHVCKNEIKAVTYHQLEVGRGREGWYARVVLDV